MLEEAWLHLYVYALRDEEVSHGYSSMTSSPFTSSYYFAHGLPLACVTFTFAREQNHEALLQHSVSYRRGSRNSFKSPLQRSLAEDYALVRLQSTFQS